MHSDIFFTSKIFFISTLINKVLQNERTNIQFNNEHFDSSIIFIFIWLFISAATPEAGNITVTVENITKEKGTMVIALFDSRENFNELPVKYIKEPVKGQKSMTVVFADVPFREYAISIYQDLDENGELNKNFLGIPTEPYGFSNNPKILTGPSYEKSTFMLDKEGISMKITLH